MTISGQRFCYGFNHVYIPTIASHNVTDTNPDITNAIIAIHGLNEDVVGSFRDAIFPLSNRTDTLVIAPWFHTALVDPSSWGTDCAPLGSLISWSSNSSWVGGGDGVYSGSAISNSSAAKSMSSFAVLDALYRDLSDHNRFPSLSRVTFTGFSAGGQMVHRYAWASEVGQSAATKEQSVDVSTDTAVPKVRFIVSDASSYLYFDNLRPAPSCTPLQDTGIHHDCEEFNAYTMIMPYEDTTVHNKSRPTTATASNDNYQHSDGSAPIDLSQLQAGIDIHLALTSCREFNEWKYGTTFPEQMAREGYSYLQPFLEDPALVRQRTALFRAKDVRYVLGGWDSCNCKQRGYTNPPHCLHALSSGANACAPSLYDTTSASGSNGAKDGAAAVIEATTCCDTYPDSRNNDLAVNCEAAMQGSNRLQRGLNYMSYLRHFYDKSSSGSISSNNGGDEGSKGVPVVDIGGDMKKSDAFAPVYALVPELQHDSATFYASEIMQLWVYQASDAPVIVPPAVFPLPPRRGTVSYVAAMAPYAVMVSLIVVVAVLGHFLLNTVSALVARNQEVQRREQRRGIVDETTHLL